MKNIFLLVSVLIFGFLTHAEVVVPAPQVIEIKSTAQGFEPSEVEVSSDAPVILKVTRTTDDTCGTEILVKGKKINKKLPLNETVTIDLGKLKKGDTKFSCAMNMIKGTLKVK